MDVACVGILVADFFASPIDALPHEGELKQTDRFWMSVGGCAANTALALRRLNRSVSVIGKVGADKFGDLVIEELGRRGVQTVHVKRSAELPTSSTLVLNVREQDRRYIHSIGANAEFGVGDIDLDSLATSPVLYVGGYLATPGMPAGDLRELFRMAKHMGLETVMDVVIPAGAAISLDSLSPVLPYTDFFLPNEDEARLLSGVRKVDEQLEVFARLNPACTTVITRGRHGSIARCGSELLVTPPFPVKTVDESGAGDAFAAGFITGLLERWPLDYTLRFAGAVGASCARALGCHDGVCYFEEAKGMASDQMSCLQASCGELAARS